MRRAERGTDEKLGCKEHPGKPVKNTAAEPVLAGENEKYINRTGAADSGDEMPIRITRNYFGVYLK